MSATDFVTTRYNLQLPDFPIINTSGAPLTPGLLVKADTGNVLGAGQASVGVTPTTAVADYGIGVVVQNIPTGAQGTIQTIDGTAVWCVALGAISAGAQVGPSTTAGKVTTYTAANPSIGIALTAAVNANDPILVLLQKSKNA